MVRKKKTKNYKNKSKPNKSKPNQLRNKKNKELQLVNNQNANNQNANNQNANKGLITIINTNDLLNSNSKQIITNYTSNWIGPSGYGQLLLS